MQKMVNNLLNVENATHLGGAAVKRFGASDDAKAKGMMIAMGIVIIGVAGVGIWFYNEKQHQKNDPTSIMKSNAKY